MKTIMVTGANAGIGLETAAALAAQGHTVIMVVRDAKKGAAARSEILTRTPSAKLDLMLCDMSLMSDVRRLAAEFKAKYDRLDVLVNNHGAIYTERYETKEGNELTFATNHLSYFLLTNLLLDVLKKSAPARIVNVASEAHKRGHVQFEDLQSQKNYNGMSVYSTSKLENIFFTYELARRLEGTGVTANCLHPGVINSNWGRNGKGLFGFGITLIRPFMINTKQGAATSIYLAASPDVEGVTGKYFKRCKAVPPRKVSYKQDIAKRLWDESLKLTGLSV